MFVSSSRKTNWGKNLLAAPMAAGSPHVLVLVALTEERIVVGSLDLAVLSAERNLLDTDSESHPLAAP